MSKKYISCADTAKLLRKALKEAFPKVLFSVRSSTYAGGASISVGWTDGPNRAQVDAVTKRFQGAYFDSSTDYKGHLYHLLDGEPVGLGADFIFGSRDYTDAAKQRAIDRVFRQFGWMFLNAGLAKPTLQEYRVGAFISACSRDGLNIGRQLHDEIDKALYKASDRLAVNPSKTAGRLFVTHSDGYSKVNLGCVE